MGSQKVVPPAWRFDVARPLGEVVFDHVFEPATGAATIAWPAARLAVTRAGERARGSVAASDAYFPFPDGLQVLLDAGVRAVVQPGGSVRDPLSIEAAAAAGVPMYLTGARHFAH